MKTRQADRVWPLIGLTAGSLALAAGGHPVIALLLCAALAALPLLRPPRPLLVSPALEPDWHCIQNLLNTLPLPIALRNGSGKTLVANEAFEDWARIYAVHREDEDLLRERHVDAAVLAGHPYRQELMLPADDTGSMRSYLISKQACKLLGREDILIVMVSDLSDIRSAEQRLQAALAHQLDVSRNTDSFVQRLIDVIPEPVYIKDENGRYIMVNDAFARQRGQARDDILWRSAIDLAPDAQTAQRIADEDQAVLQGEHVYKEDEAPHPVTEEPRYRIVTKGSCVNAQGQRVVIGANFDITQRRLSEQAIRDMLNAEQDHHQRTLDFIQRIMDLVPFPLYVKDAQSRYQMVNEAMVRDRSIPRNALLGHTGLPDTTPPDALYRVFEEDGAVLAGARVYREEHAFHDYTGREFWHVLSKDCCLDQDGNQVIVGAHIDLTDLRIAERELHATVAREVQLRERTQAFLERLLDVIPDPLYIKKAGGRYVMVNRAFADYYGLSKQEIVDANGPMRNSPPAANAKSVQEDDDILANGTEIAFEEHTTRRQTGEEVFRTITKKRSVFFDGDPVVVGFHRHITEWRQAEKELMRLANEDALTGLANRRSFRDEASRALTLAARHRHPLSLFSFDLDHFKQINDHFGHQAGDEVLVETVRRCMQTLRQSDLAARWGGEEFIVLLPHTPVEDALRAGERLRELLAATPVITWVGPVSVTLSGGVAQLGKGENLDALIARADAALYRAKREGRNAVCLATEAENSSQSHD